MTTDAEDRSTWARNGHIIRRDELLRLIEENGGPEGLDLRGAVFVGDGVGDDPRYNPIDLSRVSLANMAEVYRAATGRSEPPWLSGWLSCKDGINLEGSVLRGSILAHAQLEGACLINADLHAADLRGAHLKGASLVMAQANRAVLVSSDLREVDLAGAQLQGADLTLAHLDRSSLVSAHHGLDVSTLDASWWYGAILDNTRMKRESLGRRIADEELAHQARTSNKYHMAKEAYLALKNNFNQIGRYEDASWAYVKEQQMEKMAYHWEWRSNRWKVWRAWGSFLRWLRNWAYELATGYGERPWNPVIGGIAAILGFAGGFCATRAIASFWDALVYSIATFATFNLARLEPQGRGMEIASSLEAILGISVLALVVFTLGNRMSRG